MDDERRRLEQKISADPGDGDARRQLDNVRKRSGIREYQHCELGQTACGEATRKFPYEGREVLVWYSGWDVVGTGLLDARVVAPKSRSLRVVGYIAGKYMQERDLEGLVPVSEVEPMTNKAEQEGFKELLRKELREYFDRWHVSFG